MSYTEMLTAKQDGQLSAFAEYRNSWGFTALIWEVLIKKYERDIARSQGPSLSPFDAWPKLWKWTADHPQPQLTPWEVNTLVMSYDRAYTHGKENLLLYAQSIELFSDTLAPVGGNRVNHLPKIAADLRQAVEEGAEYVAWYGMSVAENLFWVHVPEVDENSEEKEGYDSDESHLLSFCNEGDMATIKPQEFQLVSLEVKQAVLDDCI